VSNSHDLTISPKIWPTLSCLYIMLSLSHTPIGWSIRLSCPFLEICISMPELSLLCSHHTHSIQIERLMQVSTLSSQWLSSFNIRQRYPPQCLSVELHTYWCICTLTPLSWWMKSRRWVTLSWQLDLENSEKHFFNRTNIIFHLKLIVFGRNVKRQIEQCSNCTLDLHVWI